MPKVAPVRTMAAAMAMRAAIQKVRGKCCCVGVCLLVDLLFVFVVAFVDLF